MSIGVCWLIHSVVNLGFYLSSVGTFNPIIEKEHVCGSTHIDLCDCDVNDATNNNQSVKGVPRISEIMLQTNNKTQKKEIKREREEPHNDIKEKRGILGFLGNVRQTFLLS